MSMLPKIRMELKKIGPQSIFLESQIVEDKVPQVFVVGQERNYLFCSFDDLIVKQSRDN
jgi:hypothetical protein